MTRKKLLILLGSVCLALVLVMPVSAAVSADGTSITGAVTLVARGDSTAEWTTEEVKFGDYSAKLTMPAGTGWVNDNAEARVAISGPPTLNDVTGWSFWAKGLDAYEIALEHTPKAKKDHRHHIEHCFLMSLSQMIRMERLGVLCVTQPQLLLDSGDGHFKQLGEQRTQEAFRFRTMLDNNVFTVFSSDRPCSGGIPMLGIHAAVNRRTKSGRDYGLEQAISPEMALRLYTINGAYATFEEAIKGTIEVGKLADLVLLDGDPTKVEPEQIRDISVLTTMVGGKIAYEK